MRLRSIPGTIAGMNTDDLRDLPESSSPADETPVDANEATVETSAERPAEPANDSSMEPALDEPVRAAETVNAPAEQLPLELAEQPKEVLEPLAAVEEEDEPAESYDLPQALFDAGFDVEGALGALAFDQGTAADEEPESASPRLPPFTPPNYRPALAMPRLLTVRRGQLTSLVPALILIGLGAWWTVANVTGTPVDPLLVGAVLTGGLVLTFAVAWLVNGRWARGLLLVVVLALFAAGGGALVLNAGLANALAAYPLLFSALGVAILLAGLFGRPRERAWLGPAVVFIAAGIIGYLVVAGAVPAGILSAATAYWFVPAILLLVLVALPLFVRRRS